MSATTTENSILVPLEDIALDVDLQPRQRIDKTTCEEYFDALIDGAVFPPVTVFREGAQHWLADGFHRWHAHKAAGRSEISAVVAPGTRLDALRFALGANATHGKRREPGDYRAAYYRASRQGLVDPTDVVAVQTLLRCTTQWAYRLTEIARASADAKRDADIAARKAAGHSNRAIARDVGLSHQTVARATSGPKTNGLKMDHPTESSLDLSDTLPRPPHSAPTEFNDMTSPSGQRWGALIDALRVVNDLPSAEELFNDRHRCLDVAIGPALMGAKARIDEIQRRYFGLQAEIAAAELARAQMDFLDLAGDFSRPIPSSLAMNEGPGPVRLQRPS
jgi:ParB-like nuclease domain